MQEAQGLRRLAARFMHDEVAVGEPSSAPPPVSSTGAADSEHVQLVQLLKEHMGAHGLSQTHVASEIELHKAKLSKWLGCGRDRLSAATEAEMDGLVAAYLGIEPSSAPPPTLLFNN